MTSPAQVLSEPVESAPVEESQRQSPVHHARSLQRKLSVLLFAAALAFGAVHQLPEALLYLGVALLACTALFSLRDQSSGWVSEVSSDWKLASIFGTVLLFLAYALIQYAFLNAAPPAVPVLGRDYEVVSVQSLIRYILPAVAVLLTIFLASLSCRVRHTSTHLAQLISSIGVVMALIALIHWFSDNGKLFWVFEPNYVSPSNRVRWPFVNPNHLGFFLILPFFLQLSQLISNWRSFSVKLALDLSQSRRLHFAHAITQSGHQRRLVKTTISLLALLITGIAILATQSFGTFTAVLSALLIFWVLNRGYQASTGNLPEPSSKEQGSDEDEVIDLHPYTALEDSSKRGRRRRRRKPSLFERVSFRRIQRVALTLLPLLVLLLLGSLLLSERAGELIEARLERKLLFAHEDMRHQLYSDSLELFAQAPLVGIGAGNWASHYFQVMDAGLAGINPVYLHSEPLQHLLEFGLLGTLPIAAALLMVFVIAIPLTPLKRRTFSRAELRASALTAAFLAMFIALFSDFHLRIPVNLLMFSAAVGLVIGHYLAIRFTDKKS